jgi:hypothetical protein
MGGSAPTTGARLDLRRAHWADLAALLEQPRVLRHLRSVDGCPFAILEQEAGDVLFFYESRAMFQLSADRSLVRCAAADWAEPTWQRLLLDRVLWTTSYLRGFQLLRASAVTTAAGLVAFLAVAGGGKTSLAAECVRRGHGFFCDDILALEEIDGEIWGHPGPPLMNLPVSMATKDLNEVRVIVELGDERWVEVEQESSESEPLVAIVLVDRAGAVASRCRKVKATNLTLLPHVVGFPHMGSGSSRRFEVAGSLAEATPVFRLQADPSLCVSELADFVEAEIGIL